MKEAKNGTIKIEGILGDRILKRFFWWSNYGRFEFELFCEYDLRERETIPEDIDLAVGMTLFGERIQNSGLQNAAMEDFHNCQNFMTCAWNCRDVVKRVYDNKPNRHSLRRLVALHVAVSILKGKLERKNNSAKMADFDSRFIADLFIASSIIGPSAHLVSLDFEKVQRQFIRITAWNG